MVLFDVLQNTSRPRRLKRLLNLRVVCHLSEKAAQIALKVEPCIARPLRLFAPSTAVYPLRGLRFAFRRALAQSSHSGESKPPARTG